MKSSDAKYIINHFPLVDMRMSRTDCITWLESRDLDVPPKSTCVFCPYHSPEFWKKLKAANGPDWQHAIEVDNAIRDRRPDHRLYVHSRGMPLEQAVTIPQDYGAKQMEMEIPATPHSASSEQAHQLGFPQPAGYTNTPTFRDHVTKHRPKRRPKMTK